MGLRRGVDTQEWTVQSMRSHGIINALMDGYLFNHVVAFLFFSLVRGPFRAFRHSRFPSARNLADLLPPSRRSVAYRIYRIPRFLPRFLSKSSSTHTVEISSPRTISIGPFGSSRENRDDERSQIIPLVKWRVVGTRKALKQETPKRSVK